VSQKADSTDPGAERKPFRATILVDVEASDEQVAAEIAWRLAHQIEQQPPVHSVIVESVW